LGFYTKFQEKRPVQKGQFLQNVTFFYAWLVVFFSCFLWNITKRWDFLQNFRKGPCTI